MRAKRRRAISGGSNVKSRPYGAFVDALLAAYDSHLQPIGLDDNITAKGGVRALILADHLGHKLVSGDKGADAQDDRDRLFEYKVSSADRYNFHFGARKTQEENEDLIKRHFDGLHGAICAEVKHCRIQRYAFCSSEALVPDLLDGLRVCTGGQLVKAYTWEAFVALPGVVVNRID
jgi:hypothetical protein